MRGDSESASKNTSNPIFNYPKYSNVRIFENSLASSICGFSYGVRLRSNEEHRVRFSNRAQSRGHGRSAGERQRDRALVKINTNTQLKAAHGIATNITGCRQDEVWPRAMPFEYLRLRGVSASSCS